MKSRLAWIMAVLLAARLSAAATASQQVARVRVAPGGEVYLNDEPISAERLTNELHRLRGQGDAVAFSGDTNGVNGLLSQGVFEKVVKAGLPVVMKKADGSPREDTTGAGSLVDLNFQNLPVADVLNLYAGLAGAKLLKPIGINASVTLSLEDATQGEALKAVELELSRYNISLKRSQDNTISVQWKTDW
jgi:hypothetical protein